MTKSIPWATVLLVVLVAIAALVGGGVVIWGEPGALSFEKYLDLLKNFALAVGLLGVGRGVKAGLENHALFTTSLDSLTEADLLPPDGDDGGDLPTARSGTSHV